jgi:hypothetical protein
VRAIDLIPGTEYPYRKGRRPGGAFLRVAVLQYVGAKRQAQVCHVGGAFDGLKEWVRPTDLHCEWRNVGAVIKLEAKALALEQSHEAEPPPRAIIDAANEVFAATGEDLYVDDRDVAEVERHVVDRVGHRAGVSDQDLNLIYAAPAYRNGPGWWRVPSRRLVPLAQRFAETEPGIVNLHLDAETSRYRERGYEPGERYLHQLLIDKGPAYALAREWAGANRIADALRDDNERLRKLIRDAIGRLRTAGDERSAKKLERALDGG